MKTLCKRLFALLLALGMTLSLCAAPVWAAVEVSAAVHGPDTIGAETAEPTLTAQAASSGTCGVDVAWSFDASIGKLTISGTGPMSDYEDGDDTPWRSSYWNKIKSVVIKSGVTSVGAHAFYGCGKLASVNISNTVTVIGSAAFGDCYKLTKVKIPDSVTRIGDNAFVTSGLKKVTIGKGVTRIDDFAFVECYSLKSITIPETVTSFGDDVFMFRDEKFFICGKSGSAAEAYAKKCKIPFKAQGKASDLSKTTLSGVKAQEGAKIEAKWKKNTSGKGYELHYATDKRFKKNLKKVKITSNKTVSKTVSKLKAGKTYYFRIRTVKGSQTSKWSAVKSAKAKE